MQQPHEMFDSFLIDLKLKAKTYLFDKLNDSMIRDQILASVMQRSDKVY